MTIDCAAAKSYLQQRMAEHDLGLANGNSMAPDLMALATIVIAMDAKIEELASSHRDVDYHGGVVWDALISSLLANKKALVSVVTIVVAGLSSQIIQFFEVRQLLGISGGNAVVLFIVLVLFSILMIMMLLSRSNKSHS